MNLTLFENLILCSGDIPSFDETVSFLKNERYWSWYNEIKPLTDRYTLFENDAVGVPPMNEVFYKFILNNHRIAKHKEFIQCYYDKYCIHDDMNGFWKFNYGIDWGDNNIKTWTYPFKDADGNSTGVLCKKKLNIKLMKAYMSFLKEIYVLSYLNSLGFNAKYDEQMDYAGYDIIVQSNLLYGIKIYADTKEANSKSKIKFSERNNKLVKINKISIPITNQYVIGDTRVPTNKQLEQITKMITSNCKGKVVFN